MQLRIQITLYTTATKPSAARWIGRFAILVSTLDRAWWQSNFRFDSSKKKPHRQLRCPMSTAWRWWKTTVARYCLKDINSAALPKWYKTRAKQRELRHHCAFTARYVSTEGPATQLIQSSRANLQTSINQSRDLGRRLLTRRNAHCAVNKSSKKIMTCALLMREYWALRRTETSSVFERQLKSDKCTLQYSW